MIRQTMMLLYFINLDCLDLAARNRNACHVDSLTWILVRVTNTLTNTLHNPVGVSGHVTWMSISLGDRKMIVSDGLRLHKMGQDGHTSVRVGSFRTESLAWFFKNLYVDDVFMKMWSVICGMLQQQASLRTQLIPWLSEPFLTTPEMTDAQTCWHASRHEPKAHQKTKKG